MRGAWLLWLAGCAIGAPPGFSAGDTWTMPLVDPLADERLLVPVMVHGHGPYVFEIDRDAPTTVDPTVVSEAGVPALASARLVDHEDTSHPAFLADVTDVEVGTLQVSLVHVISQVKPNHFDRDGRRIYGVLGHDFIADSLVFGFDRDKGIAWLQTQQVFHPPADAHTFKIDRYTSDGVKVAYRQVVHAKIDGADVDLHPRFADPVGTLPRELWASAHLAGAPYQTTLPDVSGVPWSVSEIAAAHQVVAGQVTSSAAFAPYDDRRYLSGRIVATLGIDFFQPFVVAADWHHQTLYLTPRGDLLATRAQRIARWGGELAACSDAACVHVEMQPPRDEAALHPVVDVRTEPSVTHDLEITVRAVDKSGTPLPNLEINLPAGVHGLAVELEPRYGGARLDVVDLSPFPRVCQYQGGCVMVESSPPP